jgi:DNA-binding response OmpR family regulator
MSRKILSISYHEPLLQTRHMLLEQQGYGVASALGFTDAIAHCRKGGFDLFILGHSIPTRDKNELIRTFRQNNDAPILSLRRHGEPEVDAAEYHLFPDDPRELLKKVAEVFAARKETRAAPDPV